MVCKALNCHLPICQEIIDISGLRSLVSARCCYACHFYFELKPMLENSVAIKIFFIVLSGMVVSETEKTMVGTWK